MIRFEDIYPLLQRAGIPTAYKQFSGTAKEIPDPPYLVYYETASDNFGADNVVHTEVLPIVVELYTDMCRDFELEFRIKKLLLEAGLYYNTNQGDIPEENVHITYFTFTIFQ